MTIKRRVRFSDREFLLVSRAAEQCSLSVEKFVEGCALEGASRVAAESAKRASVEEIPLDPASTNMTPGLSIEENGPLVAEPTSAHGAPADDERTGGATC